MAGACSEGAAMVCLTNKDIAERLLPRWLVLSLKGKKKKFWTGRKMKSLFVKGK